MGSYGKSKFNILRTRATLDTLEGKIHILVMIQASLESEQLNKACGILS